MLVVPETLDVHGPRVPRPVQDELRPDARRVALRDPRPAAPGVQEVPGQPDALERDRVVVQEAHLEPRPGAAPPDVVPGQPHLVVRADVHPQSVHGRVLLLQARVQEIPGVPHALYDDRVRLGAPVSRLRRQKHLRTVADAPGHDGHRLAFLELVSVETREVGACALEAERPPRKEDEDAQDGEQDRRLQEEGHHGIPQAGHAGADSVAQPCRRACQAEPAGAGVRGRHALDPNGGPDAYQGLRDAHAELHNQHQALIPCRHALPLQVAEEKAAERLPEQSDCQHHLVVVAHEQSAPDKRSRHLANLVHRA
mmetsp:Transcript_113525/g.321861  ORF Transcript_113525/g.321861 Transcript_113525/m.321861 type:complete len:311 (-) Transcript_113525:125-1057(-)